VAEKRRGPTSDRSPGGFGSDDGSGSNGDGGRATAASLIRPSALRVPGADAPVVRRVPLGRTKG
jgi:hypothetical protein